MKRNALMIGGFVVATLVLAVAGILWVSGNDPFTKRVSARVYYEGNVSGLSIGAPVTFRGVTVGQVADIDIRIDPKTLATTIPVLLKLEAGPLQLNKTGPDRLDIPTLVQRGLRARLSSQSIVTGVKAIDLDFLPETPAQLLGPPGETEIPALRERFGALIDQVADLPLRDTVSELRAAVRQLQDTLLAAQKMSDSAAAVLAATSKEVQLLGADSRRTLLAANQALQHVESDATATLESIQHLSDESRQAVAQAQPELQRTLVGAREATEAARLAMDRVAGLAAPGAPLRSDLDAAVRDLSSATRSLRSLSELLEERPNALIFGNRRDE